MGHVMRCIAIAEELRRRSIQVSFATQPSVAIDVLARRGFVVDTLDSRTRLLPTEIADVVVIDGYSLGDEVAAAARASGARVVRIDDRADIDPDADLVIAPDVIEGRFEHGRRAPALVGPRYALVRDEFRSRRRARADRGEGPLLVAMGGSDPHRLSLRVAVAATSWGERSVLVGPAADPLDELPDGISSVIDPPDVGSVFDAAGAVVSAAGTAAWELLAMGQVTALIAVVPDQLPAVDVIGRAGAALVVGGPQDLERFVAEAALALQEPARRAQLTEAALDLVDGMGPSRVVDEILAL
jgi:spore coat polysaccharide biosynthesis predicted glycosyltransferase SpsG